MSTTPATTAPPLSPFASSWQAQQTPGRPPILPRCAACGAWIWPVQSFCAACLGEELDWVETAGRAALLAAVRLHRGMAPDGGWPTGWTVGLAVLDEGPCVWVHLDAEPDSGPGAAVSVVVARDRRDRLVLVAAADEKGCAALATRLGAEDGKETP